MPEYEYQIASGWDAEGSFTNMESLTPGAGEALPNSSVYFFVRAYGAYSRGQQRFSATGASSYVGFASVEWVLPLVHSGAYDWLYSNYNGQNTIRTTTGVYATYSNWNVYSQFPSPLDLQAADFRYYEDVTIRHILVSST